MARGNSRDILGQFAFAAGLFTKTYMTNFIPSNRQQAILDMVAQNGFVSTEAMVAEFKVTPQTIRRDLNELGRKGKLTRFHGGAGQAKSAVNLPYEDRRLSGLEAKRKIAELTSSLITNGSSLFLNIGTTAEAVAEALLGHKDLHVATNNMHVASILSKNESFRIMLAGGQVRHHDGAVVGPSAISFVDSFRMDVGIVGISGIDESGALLDFDADEVRTAQSVMRNSQKVVLIADHHKFGIRAMNRTGHLRDVDVLVTDEALTETYATLCEASDTEVRVCES